MDASECTGCMGEWWDSGHVAMRQTMCDGVLGRVVGHAMGIPQRGSVTVGGVPSLPHGDATSSAVGTTGSVILGMQTVLSMPAAILPHNAVLARGPPGAGAGEVQVGHAHQFRARVGIVGRCAVDAVAGEERHVANRGVTQRLRGLVRAMPLRPWPPDLYARSNPRQRTGWRCGRCGRPLMCGQWPTKCAHLATGAWRMVQCSVSVLPHLVCALQGV